MDRRYRAAAVVALGSAVAALVVMCAAVRVHPWSMLGIAGALPTAVIAGWHAVTRRGLARVAAGLIVLAAVVAPVLHVLAHRPGALLAAVMAEESVDALPVLQPWLPEGQQHPVDAPDLQRHVTGQDLRGSTR